MVPLRYLYKMLVEKDKDYALSQTHTGKKLLSCAKAPKI